MSWRLAARLATRVRAEERAAAELLTASAAVEAATTRADALRALLAEAAAPRQLASVAEIAAIARLAVRRGSELSEAEVARAQARVTLVAARASHAGARRRREVLERARRRWELERARERAARLDRALDEMAVGRTRRRPETAAPPLPTTGTGRARPTAAARSSSGAGR